MQLIHALDDLVQEQLARSQEDQVPLPGCALSMQACPAQTRDQSPASSKHI